MASTGTPTPNCNLNQWLSTDKPERMDFNSDNLKIDTLLSNKVNANERPTIYDVPLLEGARYYNKSYYYKNAIGEVTVVIALQTVSGNFVHTQPVAMIPEGCRPLYGVRLPATYSGRYADSVVIDTNGEITVRMSANESVNYVFSFGTYLAQ